jgi:dihydroorotase
MAYDLLFHNAHILDPSQGIDGILDIGVKGQRVWEVGVNLDSSGCPDVRDAAGTYICPGLIDLHGHWYEGGLYGIDAEYCLNHGVTTAIDAGTTGFSNFPEFRRTVIETSRIDLLAFIHISFMGLHAPFAEELLELRYARPIETAAVIHANSDRAIGVKIRIGSMTAGNSSAALDMALQAADTAGVPLMVHISRGAKENEVLRHLRPGDILTHCFHGNQNGLISLGGKGFIEQVADGRKRGVIFDVGHGCGSFSWDTAQKAFEHHFYPDTISTDLHRYCVGPPLFVSLPDVMSKFLCLGMSLNDVVFKATLAPARALGREDKIGTLRCGAMANLFQFEIENGDFEFKDAHLKARKGTRRLKPRLTVKDGKAIPSGSISARLRDFYECDRQVLEALGPTS